MVQSTDLQATITARGFSESWEICVKTDCDEYRFQLKMPPTPAAATLVADRVDLD
jgi:hypothetical protein